MSSLRLLVPGLRFPLTDAERERALHLARRGVGGFCVFSAPAEVGELLAEFQSVAPHRLLFASDLEDGAGQQIAGCRVHPTAAALDPDAAEAAGMQTAFDARRHGITMTFAPVCDVVSNPRNPIIQARAFRDPLACAPRYVAGARRMGLRTCAKHFPGHGATLLDSHVALPVVDADEATWRARDLPPFAACFEAGVDAVMTAHLACPALTGSQDLPATLSRRVMHDLLREEMGFQGLLVTDALLMDGVLRGRSEVEAARLALDAGCDVLLCPADVDGVAAMLCEIDAPRSVERVAVAAQPLADPLERSARESVAVRGDIAVGPGSHPIRICDLHGRGAELAPRLGLDFERYGPDGVRIEGGTGPAGGLGRPVLLVARGDRAWGSGAQVPTDVVALTSGCEVVVVLGPPVLLDDLASDVWIHAPGEDSATVTEVVRRLLGR